MAKILLFGANGGIGSAILKGLHEHSVTPIDRSKVDLSDRNQVMQLAKELSEQSFDWVVSAQGIIDENDALMTFNINFFSIIEITKAFLKLTSGFINISSTAGLNPNGSYPIYSASKAALNAYTQAMAWRESDKIFVSVCPGPTNTPMRERIAHDSAKHQDPREVANVVKKIINGEYKSGDIISIREGQSELVSKI